MILEKELVEDYSVGVEEEQAFSIDTDSHVIFEILRNKMYKDKIGSICREIASNSRDANREAGRPDAEVTIRVLEPNELELVGDLSISFEDNGLGISPKKMKDIFLVYGKSDKRADNGQTGGYGLGAKTPFAYNDTFTVITTVDDEDGVRRRYIYAASLDSTLKGKMSTLDVEETDEQTGTKIIIPIRKNEDLNEFEKKSIFYTNHWTNSVYEGFKYNSAEELTKVLENDDFVIFNTENHNYGTTTELLVDGIPYPIDHNELGTKDLLGRDYKVMLKFKTGELSLQSSRESVEYVEKTKDAIIAKYETVKEIFFKMFDDIVEEQPDYRSACIFYNKMREAHHYRYSFDNVDTKTTEGLVISFAKKNGLTKSLQATYKGVPLMTNIQLKHSDIIRVVEEPYNRNRIYNNVSNITIDSTFSQRPFYLADVRKNVRRNVKIWETHSSFYLIKPDKNNLKAAYDELQNFIYPLEIDFGIYSEIEPEKSENLGSTYQKKDYVTLKLRSSNYSGNAYTRSEEVMIDRKTKQVEVDDPKKGKKIAFFTVDKLSDADWNVPKKAKVVEKSDEYTVVAVREQDYNNWLQNTTNWTKVEDAYDEVLAKVEDKLMKTLKNEKIRNIVGQHIGSKPDMYELVKDFLPVSAQNVDFDMGTTSHAEEDAVKHKLKFDFDSLERKINRIFEQKLPLIALLNIRSYGKQREEQLVHVKNYLKLIKDNG